MLGSPSRPDSQPSPPKSVPRTNYNLWQTLSDGGDFVIS